MASVRKADVLSVLEDLDGNEVTDVQRAMFVDAVHDLFATFGGDQMPVEAAETGCVQTMLIHAGLKRGVMRAYAESGRIVDGN